MKKFIYTVSRNIDQTYSRNFLSYSIIYYRINNIISQETTTIYVLDHVISITHLTYDILLADFATYCVLRKEISTLIYKKHNIKLLSDISNNLL